MKRWNEKAKNVRREALRRFANGERCVEIASDLGISRETVNLWARKAGITRQRRCTHWSHADRDEIVRRYVEEGRSSPWLADVYGITRNTVTKWVRAAGHKVRGPEKIEREEVMRLYAKFRSYRAVAEVIGRTPTGVWNVLNRARKTA